MVRGGLLFMLLFLLTPVFAEDIEVTAESIAAMSESLGAERVAEIKSLVMGCLNDVNSCDCSLFEAEGVSLCNQLTGGAMACLVDFSKPECQALNPGQIVVNGVSLESVIRKKVLAFDESITACVTNVTDCDCTVFPVSVRSFCEAKKGLQTACLDDYDLEACNQLENPQIKIFPDFTPDWVVAVLDPIIRPLVEWRQASERDSAVGGAMTFIGQCFASPYNCDCSPIKFPSIRADCLERARLMRACLEYRDCMTSVSNATTGDECAGRVECTELVNMPLVPEVTPAFMRPFIEPEVLRRACPLMKGWPYDKGNYASCV